MTRTIYFLAAAFLLLSPGLSSAGMRPVPVDVVMAEGELFFVLEEPKEIQAISVTIHLSPMEIIAEAKKNGDKRNLTLWTAESAVQQGEKAPKYPKLAQIRYARKAPGLTTTKGPVKLKRNVKYKVRIEIAGKEFASEIFFIDDKGNAVVPSPTFSRQKDRSYSLSKDKDGNKMLVPAEKGHP